jgi:hypothetical protein
MAGGKTLKVTILGDAASLQKVFGEVDASAVKFEARMAKTGKSAEDFAQRSEHAFGRIKEAAKGLAEIAGVSALAFGLKDVTEEAVKAQAEQLKLANTVKDAGLSWKAHSKEIDEWLDKTSRASGFAKSELTASLGNLIRTTGNVTKARELDSQAMDVARSKGMSLASAQSLLARVYNGSFLGLKRLGIAVTPVTTAQDALSGSTTKATAEQKAHAKQLDATATRTEALGLITQKFGGQSAAYAKSTAGAFDRAKASLQLVEERVGAVVLPLMAKAAGGIASLAESAQKNWPQISAQANRVFGPLKATFETVTHAIGDVVKGFKDGKTWAVALVSAIGGLTAAVAVVKTITLAVAAWTKATEAMAAAQALLDAAMDANPLTIAAAAIIAIGAALVIAYKNSATFRAIVGDAFKTIRTVAADAFDVITLGLRQFLTGIGKVTGLAAELPGMGWLKSVSKAALGAAGELAKISTAIRGIPEVKNLKVMVDAQISPALKALVNQPNSLTKTPPAGLKKAAGGVIPGHGSGDTVPAMLTPGEFVIRKAVVDKYGPTFFAGLNGGWGNGTQHFMSGGQVAKLARNAGFTGSSLVTALAVADAESRWKEGASNKNKDGSIDRGLWQINSSHGKQSTFDPAANARAAFAISKGGKDWHPWVTFVKGTYGKYMDAARTAVIGSRASSATDRADQQEKQGSRIVNTISNPFFSNTKTTTAGLGGTRTTTAPGISSLQKIQTGRDRVISEKDTQYSQAERGFDQSTEDLGTATGRTTRISELTQLKKLKQAQLQRQKARQKALETEIHKYDGLTAKLRAQLKGKNRATGATAARIHQRLTDYENRRADLAAEAQSLGSSITDTKLDLSDLDDQASDVANTPDTGTPTTPQDTVDKALSDIDAHVRAGDMTQQQGDQAKIDTINGVLANPNNGLTADQTLAERGNLADTIKDLTSALQDNTTATTSSLDDLKASIDQQNAIASSTNAVELSVVQKAIADMVSGQLGQRVAHRAMLPGSGMLARF